MFSKYTAITKAQIDRRNYWVKEIEKLSGRFTADFDRLRDELRQEVKALKTDSLLSHLRLCGAIPERYGHDSSEEKLYSKYTAMKQLDQIHISSAKELLKGLGPESIHALISDIPYGIGAEDWDVLHNNTNSALLGTSPAQQKAGAVFKNRGKPLNGWSEADRAIPKEYYEWCMAWVPEAKRVLKPGGSAIIFAGRRLAHRCECAFEDSGFTLKDILAWMRPRAPHRAQRMSVVFERRNDPQMAAKWQGWRLGNLRPVFEPVLWFTKPYTIGTTIADNASSHEVGGFNQDAFLKYVDEPNNVLEIGFISGESGLHPTQKPVLLMQALIELTTQPGQIVLDPFCGSGTTAVAARNTNRHFIAGDISAEFCQIARDRFQPDLFAAPLRKG